MPPLPLLSPDVWQNSKVKTDRQERFLLLHLAGRWGGGGGGRGGGRGRSLKTLLGFAFIRFCYTAYHFFKEAVYYIKVYSHLRGQRIELPILITKNEKQTNKQANKKKTNKQSKKTKKKQKTKQNKNKHQKQMEAKKTNTIFGGRNEEQPTWFLMSLFIDKAVSRRDWFLMKLFIDEAIY